MKKKLITGLVLATALLSGMPAFAQSRGPGSAGGGSYGGHSYGGRASGTYVSGGGAARSGGRGYGGGTISGRSYLGRPNFAFGGSAYNSTGHSNPRAVGAGYAFSSREGWSANQEYNWHGHHYRWINNGWYIVDPYLGQDGQYYYYDGESLNAQVQSVLYQLGYYNGPLDGSIGPGTQAAIVAYQKDNGLQVSGIVDVGLLDSLGLD